MIALEPLLLSFEVAALATVFATVLGVSLGKLLGISLGTSLARLESTA